MEFILNKFQLDYQILINSPTFIFKQTLFLSKQFEIEVRNWNLVSDLF